MTATQTGDTPACQVGDRIRVHRNGTAAPGRTSSINTTDSGDEYVPRTNPADSGTGHVLNMWTRSGQSSFRTCASVGNETR